MSNALSNSFVFIVFWESADGKQFEVFANRAKASAYANMRNGWIVESAIRGDEF